MCVFHCREELLKDCFELRYLRRSFPPRPHFSKNATISIFTFKLAFVKLANLSRQFRVRMKENILWIVISFSWHRKTTYNDKNSNNEGLKRTARSGKRKIYYIVSHSWAPITVLFGSFSWMLTSEAGAVIWMDNRYIPAMWQSLFKSAKQLERMRQLRMFL